MTEEARKLAELRFFRDLIDAERMKVFKAFGLLPQDCTETLSHGIQRKLFNEIAALRSEPGTLAREKMEKLKTHVDQRMNGFSSRSTSIYQGTHIAEELADIGNRIDAILALTPSYEESKGQVLNAIRDALEIRGYFHMANGRDIGILLDAIPAGTQEPVAVTAEEMDAIEAAAIQGMPLTGDQFENIRFERKPENHEYAKGAARAWRRGGLQMQRRALDAEAALKTAAPASHDATREMEEIDYDDPRFNQGVEHVVDLLAKTIGSTEWSSGDGSEDYNEDLAQTLLNILAGKGLYDRDTGAFASPTARADRETK